MAHAERGPNRRTPWRLILGVGLAVTLLITFFYPAFRAGLNYISTSGTKVAAADLEAVQQVGAGRELVQHGFKPTGAYKEGYVLWTNCPEPESLECQNDLNSGTRRAVLTHHVRNMRGGIKEVTVAKVSYAERSGAGGGLRYCITVYGATVFNLVTGELPNTKHCK